MLPIEDAVDAAGDDQGENQEPADDDPSAAHFQSYFQMLGQDLNESETAEWLNEDCADNGYAHLTDSEIITEVLSHPTADNHGSRLHHDCNSKPIIQVSYFLLQCKHFSNIRSPNFLIDMMATKNTGAARADM